MVLTEQDGRDGRDGQEELMSFFIIRSSLNFCVFLVVSLTVGKHFGAYPSNGCSFCPSVLLSIWGLGNE